MHFAFFVVLYAATALNLNIKKVTPLSQIQVSLYSAPKKSTIKARPAIQKPIVQKPKPKPADDKPKPAEKKIVKPEKNKDTKITPENKILTPNLPPAPTPEPQPEPEAQPEPQIAPPPVDMKTKNAIPAVTNENVPEGGFLMEGAGLPDYYVANARLLIMSHFNVPSYLKNTDAKCRVSFNVAKDGTVSNIKVEESSGNNILDLVAEKAVQESGSLAPLPDEYNTPSIQIFVTFDFNYTE